MADRKKPPRTDFEAQAYIKKMIKVKYISPQERQARVLAAMKVKGIKTKNELAMLMGVYPPTVRNLMESKNVRLNTLQAAALVLGVEVDYLIEKEPRSAAGG